MFLANKLSGSGIPQKTYADDVFAAIPYAGSGATFNIPHNLGYVLPWLCARNSPNSSLFFNYYNVNFVNNTTYYSTNSSAAPTTDSSVASNGGLTNNIPLGANSNATSANVNKSGNTYIAYCFKIRTNFFSFPSYTGSGGLRTIDPGLGRVPALMIFKGTSGSGATANWLVWHESFTDSQFLEFNTNGAVQTAGSVLFGSKTASSVQIASSDARINASTSTYSLMCFGNDTSTDGLIRCGTYTGNGTTSGPVVDLGWEPQWLMVKNVSGIGSWNIIDTTRGWTFEGLNQVIQADTTNAETAQNWIGLRSNGFQVISTSSEVNTNGATYLYLAVRKNNKPPTIGTDVFNVGKHAVSAGGNILDIGLTQSAIRYTDMYMVGFRNGETRNVMIVDKVRGIGKTVADTKHLCTSSTSAETTTGAIVSHGNLAGFETYYQVSPVVGQGLAEYSFKRAEGFFDIVAYNGNSSTQTVRHNLGTLPELILCKTMNVSGPTWKIFYDFAGSTFDSLALNVNAAGINTSMAATAALTAAPTASNLFLGWSSTATTPNASGSSYIAYLFASKEGISKIGTYTGDSTNRVINCGFSGGARLVIVKRIDTTGDWYVFDTARGINAAGTSEPYLLLNSSAAEVSSDILDAATGGFGLSNTSSLNVNTGIYLYIAIA